MAKPLRSIKFPGMDEEYVIPAVNLLDNSDFRNPVNQRGVTQINGATGGADTYTIDRWFVGAASCRLTVNDGYISMSQNTSSGSGATQALRQNVDVSKFAGKTFTMAAKVRGTSVRLLMQGASPTPSYKALTEWTILCNTFTVAEGTETIQACIQGALGSTWDCQWAALYEGEYTAETLPEYRPKGYAEELAICAQYDPYKGNHVGVSVPGCGYGGNAIGLPSEGRVDSEAELETALQSVYAEMASTATKLVFWNGYPAGGESMHGWFGILAKSSENNGGFFGWSACDSGTTIRKVKFSGAWQPLETLATTAYVNAQPAMDSIWYNESPRSTFAAQKVKVDLSAFNYIAIIPNYNDDATRRGHFWVSQCPSDSAGFLNVFKANDATMASRHVTKIETDGITFSDASVSIKGAAGTTNNKYCVPLQIFGIKVG